MIASKTVLLKIFESKYYNFFFGCLPPIPVFSNDIPVL
jgi:hypothetical protein